VTPDRKKYLDAKHDSDLYRRKLKEAVSKLDDAKESLTRLTMYLKGLAAADEKIAMRVAKELGGELEALRKVLYR
jgi:hypothetical protein